MQTAKRIVSELEIFGEIEKVRTINNLAKSGLIGNLKNNFRYAKVKMNKLIFVFGINLKLEFNMQRNLIKERMREHYRVNFETMKLYNISFSDIEMVVIKAPEVIEDKPAYMPYVEPAKGEFQLPKNISPLIRRHFEDIRRIIKERKNEL